MSKFLDMIVKEKSFENKIEKIISNLSGKKVLVYGVGLGFEELNKKFKLTQRLNICGYSDKKFENEDPRVLNDVKTILPEKIDGNEFDCVIITLEKATPIQKFLTDKQKVDDSKIVAIFEEEIKDEFSAYNYLEEFNFRKNIVRLERKLKGKTSVIYGAGVFFEAINKYYDLSKLNIIGICDKRFSDHAEGETFLGYKVMSVKEVKEVKPDYVLVATKFYINIIEDLFSVVFKKEKFKIKPLVAKPILTLLKEIWN